VQVNTGEATGRREQILLATIEVVAEYGYHGTSFARVIEHAQLSSTRLISYHFRSRDVLMREVLDYVVGKARDFMQPRIALARTARDRLAAYIRGNLEFLQDRPSYAVAAVQIVSNLPAEPTVAAQGDTSAALLEQFFVTAQAAGEMRPFDPMVMAVSLRAAIDAAVLRYVDTQMDLSDYADELVGLFDRATAMED
jgi:AcrR family transcriptional regulator